MSQLIEAPAVTCDPATRVTRSLLGYGVIAGPMYVVVSLTEGLTRDGFDLRHDAWSLLSNGPLGWIHIANLALTGLMTIAFAAGLRRTAMPAWSARLIGGYGLSLVGAAIFRADPPPHVSWHGTLHFVSGGIGFACLIAACLVLARRFAAQGQRAWARFSATTGLLFLAGFAGVASGSGGAWTNLGFTAVVILACAWMSALAVHLYRD